MAKHPNSRDDCSKEEDTEDFFDPELFVDTGYKMKNVSVGGVNLSMYALHTAASNHNLTGQIIWPASKLLALYLTEHSDLCRNSQQILELGSGAGLSGLIAACLSGNPSKVILTDNNSRILELLRKNIDANFSNDNDKPECKELCWGTAGLTDFMRHYNDIHLIIGADVVFWPQAVPLLFETVHFLLTHRPKAQFILSYTNRANHSTNLMFENAQRFGLCWKTIDLSLEPENFQAELRKHSLDITHAKLLVFTLAIDNQSNTSPS